MAYSGDSIIYGRIIIRFVKLKKKEKEKFRIIKEIKKVENKEDNNNFNIKTIVRLFLISDSIFGITLIKKEEKEFNWAELDVEYNFDRLGIRDFYEIPLNFKEFKKTEEKKKEKKKKEKKKKN